MTFRVFPPLAQALQEHPPVRQAPVIRRSAASLSATEHVFVVPSEAQAFVEGLARLPLGAVAIDTEYRYRAPPVRLRGGGAWYDPSKLDPLILTGAAWVPQDGHIIRFLFDLRVPGMAAVIEHLLGLRTTFVAHHFKAEFMTLWALSLDPVIAQTYDTYVAARALLLGRGHPALVLRRQAQEDEDFDGVADSEETIASVLSLAGQCEAYDLPHPYGASKGLLQTSFLDHKDGAAFTDHQIEYALADADMTLRVYLAQQPDVLEAGLHAHLHQIEFPFVEANARAEFDGVPVDRDRLADLADGLSLAVARYAAILRELGLENPASPQQVVAFLIRRGWRDKITFKSKLTSKDEVLAQIEAQDPAVSHIRQYRRYKGLLGGQLLSGELIGSDGRFHPNHRHLGAETGRNTCSAPNVIGLSRHFRPVVTAPTCRAIFEVDYAQIEVGIAAAEAGDVTLIAAFNSGDVYAAVAQSFYRDTLTSAEREMTLAAFKAARRDLRDRIKVFVLATLYNMQDQSVADRFSITLQEAKAQRRAFLDQYPGIRDMMHRAVTDGRISGFAPIVGGLRRHVPNTRVSANQHINTPVQAGAGVVFRKAVVDLYRAFRGTSARIILPVHDAVVVECDAGDIETVRTLVEQIMIQAVRSFYPQLCPRVDINASDPTCWNKDGQGDALETFLAEARSGASRGAAKCMPDAAEVMADA